MKLIIPSILLLFTAVFTSCTKKLIPTEEEAREALYIHLQAVRNQDYEGFKRINKIKEEHQREFFDASVSADALTREILSRFGREGIQRYISPVLGDFEKVVIITDIDFLEKVEDGVYIHVMDGYRLIDTYPFGRYVVTRDKNGECVLNMDVTVTDYRKFMDVMIQPAHRNTLLALELIETKDYETARDFVADVKAHLNKNSANQSEVSIPLAPASLTP